MDTHMGPTDALLAAYFQHEQQTLQGVQGSALGPQSPMLNGMLHGSATGHSCAVAMAPQQQQHGLFMQGSLNGMFAGHNKQEQLAACFKDHASTAAAAAAEQAACAAAAAAVRQDSSASGPEYTSVFSMPHGMMPTPFTAAVGINQAALGMQIQQPTSTWFAASAASSTSSFAVALQQQQQQQQQHCQQHHNHQQQLMQQVQQQHNQRQQQQQLFSHGSFSSTLLPAGAPLHAVPAVTAGGVAGGFGAPADAAAAAAAVAACMHSQPLSSTGLPAHPPVDDEPDLRHLTVMQRYHARRKLAVQRMEREVEEKLAQLALLEQENRKLKWQAHILEHMLLDIDKQLEVMAHCESTPDASQWVTLLGMGQPASAGGAGRVARTVHRMLEGAGQTSVAGWTVQNCREHWLSFLDALRPLVQEAEAAQAEYRAAQQAARPEAASGGGGSAGGGSRRPRRAAAAAAAAVIQQEAEDVLGVIPLPASRIPEPPVPAPAVSSSPGQQQQQAGDGNMQQHQFLRTQSACSGEQSQQGSECCEPAAHAWSVEGVPQPLLSQIEQLVLGNFSWLLAVMTSNPVLTYEFISMDLIDGTSPLPPQEHSLWAEAVSQVQPTLDQMQECSTCIEVSRRCMAKVMEERAEIQESLQCSVESEMHTHTSEDVLQLNSRDAAVDRMRANVRKESVVRNMVGFYCINVLSMYQLAKLALACAPWFSMAWRVIGAMEEALAARLAAQAAQQGGGRGTAGRHATRASTRAASQR